MTLLLNRLTDFIITSQECLRNVIMLMCETCKQVVLFQSCLKHLIPSRTLVVAASEKGKIAKILKTSSPKVLAQFENYFVKMFLGGNLYQNC